MAERRRRGARSSAVSDRCLWPVPAGVGRGPGVRVERPGQTPMHARTRNQLRCGVQARARRRGFDPKRVTYHCTVLLKHRVILWGVKYVLLIPSEYRA
jgi:hypothetical protein